MLPTLWNLSSSPWPHHTLFCPRPAPLPLLLPSNSLLHSKCCRGAIISIRLWQFHPWTCGTSTHLCLRWRCPSALWHLPSRDHSPHPAFLVPQQETCCLNGKSSYNYPTSGLLLASAVTPLDSYCLITVRQTVTAVSPAAASEQVPVWSNSMPRALLSPAFISFLLGCRLSSAAIYYWLASRWSWEPLVWGLTPPRKRKDRGSSWQGRDTCALWGELEVEEEDTLWTSWEEGKEMGRWRK